MSNTGGTMAKEYRDPKIDRRIGRLRRKSAEDLEMRYVRRRDRRCRFPLCGCGKLGLTLDVSHSVHRGMGGNPAGDRTDRRLMLLVCRQRHRFGRVAIDRGTLRWEPLDAHAGAEGPVRWLVDGFAVGYPGKADEIELAREIRPGEIEPLQPFARALLEELAKMNA